MALCGQVAIFELRTAQLVLQLPCHQKAVRSLGQKRGRRGQKGRGGGWDLQVIGGPGPLGRKVGLCGCWVG